MYAIKNLISVIRLTTSVYLLALSTLILSGCEGSGKYRGKWKATAVNGAKYEITFNAKSFTVNDSTANPEAHDYTQYSYTYDNGITTYGIALANGRKYLLRFPNKDEAGVAIMMTEGGALMYTLSRNKFITNDDMYKLK
ncbi:MAG: hypothetical protein JST86_13625 [Bacteroidetes bacterium]|nr:hypothetical protein [Bacteroidota bacterium]